MIFKYKIYLNDNPTKNIRVLATTHDRPCYGARKPC